jgi:endonuclease-3 related protein
MKNKIQELYDLMYLNLGPQGWWPVYDLKLKKCVYIPNRYTKNSHKLIFEISVGALLTQNTSWINVEKALGKLKEERYLSPKKIYKASFEKLYELIRSSGYYRQKAEKLKNLSLFFIKNSLKELSKKNILELRKMLLEIKGIGRETADSIILYGFQKPIFVIDDYTRRIYLRFFGDEKDYDYDELREIFEKSLKHDLKIYSEYHALFVEVAKRYCLKKMPLCEKCFLSLKCFYAKEFKNGKHTLSKNRQIA